MLVCSTLQIIHLAQQQSRATRAWQLTNQTRKAAVITSRKATCALLS
jgi:hypothetical protein